MENRMVDRWKINQIMSKKKKTLDLKNLDLFRKKMMEFSTFCLILAPEARWLWKQTPCSTKRQLCPSRTRSPEDSAGKVPYGNSYTVMFYIMTKTRQQNH